MHIGYYINLDRMTSRRAFMDSQLSALRLDTQFARWPGHDAAALPTKSIDNYLPRLSGSTHQPFTRWQLSAVEVSIFESHRTIWKDVVARQLPYAIILEDDIKLSKSLHDVIRQIDEISQLVDVLKLDWVRKYCRFGPRLPNVQLELRPIVKQRIYSCGAYLISSQGARKLLAWSDTYSDLVDAFVFSPRDSYRLFQLFPALALQGGLMSNLAECELKSVPTTSVPDLGVPRRLFDKGPLWFRLQREARLGLQRASHLLGGDLRLKREGGVVGIVPLAADLQRYY